MMEAQTISLTFMSDNLAIKGVLHVPKKTPAPFVVGCHGLFADKESPKQIALAEACGRVGVAYFRFDHRGCGQSAGDFPKVTSLVSRCRDLVDAVVMLESRPETGKLVGFFGSSMGGAVILNAAGHFPFIRLVTVAAPLKSDPVIQAIRQSRDPMLGKIPPEFFDRTLRFDISRQVYGLNNILVIHGDNDQVVPYENAEQIFAACEQPKKLLRQKNGDHRITAVQHQKEFIRNAAEWLTGLPHQA